MFNFLLISLATASIALGFSMTKPFAIVRNLAGKIWGPLGAMLGCPFMVCYPVAFALAFLMRDEEQAWQHTVVLAFAVTTVAGMCCAAICKSMPCAHESAEPVEAA